MKIMDLIVEEMNKSLSEEQKASGEKFERLHSEPVQIVETPTGNIHRDVKSGKFVNKSTPSEHKPVFNVVWFRYPHGIEGEEMGCKEREFDSLEAAINFLEEKCARICGIYWAGGHVEDERGAWVYEITDCGDRYKA